MNRVFKYETPAWGAKLICLAYFLASGGFLIAYESWAGNSPWIFKYPFLILSLAFLLALLKPTNWKGRVYFIADDDGIHFPAFPSSSKNSTYLDVSWDNVGSIKREKLYGGISGISIELKISLQELNEHFSHVARANQIRGEYFVIAYANNTFQKPSAVVNQIIEIKGD